MHTSYSSACIICMQCCYNFLLKEFFDDCSIRKGMYYIPVICMHAIHVLILGMHPIIVHVECIDY